MAEERVYQRFDLDRESFLEDLRACPPGPMDKFRKALRAELIAKNYEYFESNAIFHGVPESIILGCLLSVHRKDDFFEIAERFRVPYKPGGFYLQIKPEEK